MTAPWRAALVMALLSGTALAADPATLAPAIDFRDLPPLPDVEIEESVTSMAVVAATQAEEDTVVGAAKREQSLGNVASAVTVISGDRLRRFGYRTVAEALRSVAGIYITDDRQTPRVGIRGLQLLGDFNTRILVLIDGATVNEPWNQYTGIAQDLPVHIDDVARIEVIRGPVSSVYGTNAFFGIINIITRSADQSPRAYIRGTGGGFLGEEPSVAGAFNGGFAWGDVHRQVRGTVSVVDRAGETVSIPAFADSGAPSAKTSADGIRALNASVVGQYRGAFAQVRAYTKERELTGAPYDTKPGDARNQNTDQHLMIEAGYTREVGKRATVTARGYVNRYQFQDYLVYEHNMEPNFRDIGDSTWGGAEVRTRVDLLSRQRLGLTTGLEVQAVSTRSKSFEEDNEAGGVVVPKDFNQQGLYLEADATPSKRLSLTGGVRLDRNSLFDNAVSPRAALFVRPTGSDDFGIKLLYARGFRNPSPFEAFFEDDIDFIGNPALKPEKIDSFEAVLFGKPRPGLSLRLSGYGWLLRDLIETNTVTTAMGDRLQFQNIFEMQSIGAEAEAFFRDVTGWVGFANATFANVTRDGESTAALNAPLFTGGFGVSTPRLYERFHLSTELSALTARRTREPGVKAEPYLGWNVVFHMPDLGGLDFTLAARNLIGVREQVPAQEDFDRTNPLMPDDVIPVNTLPGEGLEIYARLGYSYR